MSSSLGAVVLLHYHNDTVVMHHYSDANHYPNLLCEFLNMMLGLTRNMKNQSTLAGRPGLEANDTRLAVVVRLHSNVCNDGVDGDDHFCIESLH
jgi:hypothetical protein